MWQRIGSFKRMLMDSSFVSHLIGFLGLAIIIFHLYLL